MNLNLMTISTIINFEFRLNLKMKPGQIDTDHLGSKIEWRKSSSEPNKRWTWTKQRKGQCQREIKANRFIWIKANTRHIRLTLYTVYSQSSNPQGTFTTNSSEINHKNAVSQIHRYNIVQRRKYIGGNHKT